ncbi:hypothetical protein WMF30_10960 [Sorangium sp. So ce134]
METLVQQQNYDADVTTSAPPLDGIPAGADLEETWDGDDESIPVPATVSPRGRLNAALAAAALLAWGHDDECPHRDCDGEPGSACDPCDADAEPPCACSGSVALEFIAAARARVADLEGQLARAEAHGLFYENLLDLLAETADAADERLDVRVLGMLAPAVRAGIDTVPAERRFVAVRAAIIVGATARARIASLEADLAAERERAAACVTHGTAGLTDAQVAEEFVRRFNPERVELWGAAGRGCATIEFRRWVAWDIEAGVECAGAAEAIVRAKEFAGYVTGVPGVLADVTAVHHGPVPAASVLVCRDDAGDHAREDAAQ